MIALNEAHHMRQVLENLQGFASEIFLVDSFSTDDTVRIAREFGVHVVQRKFEGFGAQWKFAVDELPITSDWTMKLDPDERMTPELARELSEMLETSNHSGFTVDIRLWFMGRPMPPRLRLPRIWRTGMCHFTDVLVNEHPVIRGSISHVDGEIEHHDSPSLHHWFEKQNKYTTAEAEIAYGDLTLATTPRLFGTRLERRMWLKRAYRRIPLRHLIMFLYCFFWLGAWRAGKVGYVWSRLRSDVYRMIEYKQYELQLRKPKLRPSA